MMPQVFSFQVLLRTENPSTVVATVAAADIGLVQGQVDGGGGCAVVRRLRSGGFALAAAQWRRRSCGGAAVRRLHLGACAGQWLHPGACCWGQRKRPSAKLKFIEPARNKYRSILILSDAVQCNTSTETTSRMNERKLQ